MRFWLMNAATAVMVLSAVAITTLVVRRELSGSGSVPEAEVIANWQTYAEDGNRIGPADTPVTIVVFSDFQCPACGRLAERMLRVRERYPEELAVVYRHVTLPHHRFSPMAARASECAGQQGSFAAYHDALYAGQARIGVEEWTAFARTAGVPDMAAFTTCLEDEALDAVARRDMEAATRLQITATPTMLVNGRRIRGAPSEEQLEKMVRDAVRAAR
jgi:protein-disulfide isomerase